MTATYALDLTAMSADLFCRRDGGWVPAGTIPLPETDLGARLLDLLAQAGAAPGTRVAVALPPEEVVVLTLPGGAGDPYARARAAVLLERRIDPDTLRLDWSESAGGLAIVAVPLATLGEAEAFLRTLGLEPAGCGARFGSVPFASGAWFGFADSAAAADGRVPRPDFLPLPWTTQPGIVLAAAEQDAAEPLATEAEAAAAPSADAAESGADAAAAPAGDPPARRPAAGPMPPVLGAHELSYQAARARALAIARRSPLALAPLPETPAGNHALTACRPAALAVPPKQRRDWPKRSPDFARQSRRGAILSLCLAAGLAAASFLPEIAWPWSPRQEPGPGWDTGLEQDAAVWLDTGAAEDGAEVIVDAGSDDPEILLASFAPATVYAAPATPAGIAALSYPGIDRVFRTDALTLTDRARKPGSTAPQVGLTKPSVPHETFAYDDKGLIRPTRGGTLSPEGYKVFAGKPPARVLPRPERSEAVPPVIILTGDASAAADNPLRNGDPRPRPAGLSERFERARLGGKTEKELAAAAPRHRPASAQETAVAATPAAAPSSYAVAAGPRPAARTDESRSAFEVASASPLVIPAALAPLANAPAPVAAPPKAPARAAVAAAAPARPVAPQKPASVKAAAAAKPAAAAPKPAAPAAPKTQVAARPSPEPATKTRTATASKAAPAPAQPKTVIAEIPAKTRAQPARTQPAQAKPAATRTAAAAPAATTTRATATTTAKTTTKTAGAQPAETRSATAAASKTAPKTQAASKQSEVTLVASAASGASPKQVQDRATDDNMLDLSELNLLGTFGSNADARAIVRMPNGKVVNVAVGDKLDGGRVAAIGDGQLNYVKRGRTHTLQMPQG